MRRRRPSSSSTLLVLAAVVASTLTTIAVFFPMVFISGIAGQLFRDQALTVTFALAVSLVVAMTLIPMMASVRGRQRVQGGRVDRLGRAHHQQPHGQIYPQAPRRRN